MIIQRIRSLLVLCLLTNACTPLHAGDDAPSSANIHRRGSLDNARIEFERNKRGHVAFIGGSITEMNGYRPMVGERLAKRFPDTKFTFTNAGISSTCSTTGAFRLATDVLAAGPVDLFFLEFAVNDDQDAAHARRECIRGLEGLVRHARRHNPQMDIVVTFFVNEGMLDTFGKGKTPLTIEAHTAVAERYQISTIDLAREVHDEIAAGKLTWKQYGGVHPAPHGNAICATMIDGLLDQAWSKPLSAGAEKIAHLRPEPLDPLCYEHGRFIDPVQAKVETGWRLHKPNWKELKGSTRARYNDIPLMCADEAGARLQLEFSGTAVGAYVVAGPDAGVVEASVDGGPPTRVNLFHRFSAGLHYPRTVMFATDLEPGKHTLVLRMTDETKSSGHAARIVQFVAN